MIHALQGHHCCAQANSPMVPGAGKFVSGLSRVHTLWKSEQRFGGHASIVRAVAADSIFFDKGHRMPLGMGHLGRIHRGLPRCQ